MGDSPQSPMSLVTQQPGRVGQPYQPQLPCRAPQRVWGIWPQDTAGLKGRPTQALCPPPQVPLGYNYRAEVRRLIPQVQVLDDVPATLTSPPASRKLDQDWLMVKAAIQEGRVLDGLLPTLGMAATPPGLEVSPTEPQRGLQPCAPFLPEMDSCMSHHFSAVTPRPQSLHTCPQPPHPPTTHGLQDTQMLAGGAPWSVDSLGRGGLLGWPADMVLVTSDFDPRPDRPHGDPIWRLSPELSLPETQPWAPGPWPLALLVPRGPLPEDLLPKDQAPGNDASNLTHGN